MLTLLKQLNETLNTKSLRAHELSLCDCEILLEYFADCKDQNELDQRNEHSKELDRAAIAKRFKKLGLIELRKLLGQSSSSQRDGLRQLVETSVSKVSRFAGCFPLASHQIRRHEHMRRRIVLPVSHQIIQFPES
jgi:hypothetical protein